MNVIWTLEADKSFNKIVDYLWEIWNLEIATSFVDTVDHIIELILKNPKMFKVSEFNRVNREAFITEHTIMYYRTLEDTIEIEYFWGNFDNPEK